MVRSLRLLLPSAFFVAVATGLACCESAMHPTRVPMPSLGGETLVQPFAMGKPDIVLLVTGSTNGVLEPCDCSPGMPSGMTRRSGLIQAYRTVFPRSLLLDTGDALPERSAAQPIHEYVMRAYRLMGYDTLVLGEQEWLQSPAALAHWRQVGGCEFLSTSVQENSSLPGESPIVPVVRRQWGKIRLAVLSDLDLAENVPAHPTVRDRFKRLNPSDWSARVQRLKEEGDVVVVVSHGSEAFLETLAPSIPADLFVRGHMRGAESDLRRVAGRPVVSVGGPGFVGVVALQLQHGQITRIEYRLERVEQKWPADPRLKENYYAYAQAALAFTQAQKPVPGLHYTPSAACGTCHQGALETWQKTRHASAYTTLVTAHRQDDPDCLACHTTGLGIMTGFRSISSTPDLAGVHCQSCHLLDANEHQRSPKAAVARPTAATCAVCHTPTTDPKFDYPRHLKLIRSALH